MLHNVSTWFEAGKAYAIVGGSGSGKSTLLNLLTAANIEYSGSITLDGIEIRDIAPESLYDIISVIQQNVFVFNASIKDNVSMFRLFDNAELDDAIRRAHLGELIAERGENYLCGENGSALSGGERQPVRTLSCITADALSGMCPAGGENVAVCRADYEAGVTTLWLADTADDAIICEAKLKGAWALKEQTFADGRFALCNRDTNTWKFMSAELMEISSVQTENADGFFSYAADKYYYLSDNVLCMQDIKSGERGAVPLSPDLRLLYISAFDNKSGLIAAQFFLSPYSSECGTAIIDIAAGRPVMLQKERYQAYFTPNGIRLMYFDSDAMAYSFLYSGSDGRAMLADSGIFIDAGGDIYSVADSPYVIGIIGGKTTLYSMDNEIKSCSLAESGIAGEMYNSCCLYDAGVLVGAAYHGGEFRFYAADVNALEFEYVADAAETASPFTVDESLAPGILDGGRGRRCCRKPAAGAAVCGRA